MPVTLPGATVPTNTEYVNYKASQATINVEQDRRLGLIEGRLSALEALVPPVVTPPIVPPIIPPVVPPVVGTWPHQPAGFRTLTDQPWLGVQSLGWQYLRRGASKDAIILTDTTAPLSPPTALRIIFTPDMGSDQEPGVHWLPMNTREVYWAYSLRISPGWHASPAGACKMTYCMAPNSNLWTALNHPPGLVGPPFHAVARTEWLGRYWLPQTPTPITPGAWFFYEWYTKLASSASATDGILRWWVNGQLNGDYTNVPGTPASGFGEFQIAPTVQQPPPVEQYMDVDHMYVSTP